MDNMLSYEPFGVFVVISKDDEILIDRRKDNGFYLPFSLGLKGENPQECAKRFVSSITEEKLERVVSLPFVERLPVSFIPQSIFAKWPQGMKTFPSYAFLAKVKQDKIDNNQYCWLEKRESFSLIDSGMERRILSLSVN